MSVETEMAEHRAAVLERVVRRRIVAQHGITMDLLDDAVTKELQLDCVQAEMELRVEGLAKGSVAP